MTKQIRTPFETQTQEQFTDFLYRLVHTEIWVNTVFECLAWIYALEL